MELESVITKSSEKIHELCENRSVATQTAPFIEPLLKELPVAKQK